jgi:hypothetical protein
MIGIEVLMNSFFIFDFNFHENDDNVLLQDLSNH